MRFYARDELLRSRQIIQDALVATWVLAWALVARTVHRLISGLAAAGRRLEDAGADLGRSAGGAGGRVHDLPVVGDRLAEPFDAVAAGGSAVADAGIAQQDAVAALATAAALLIALVPITWALSKHLTARWRWVRRSAAADSLLGAAGGDLRMFALRALSGRPLHELRRVGPDPYGSFERGDPEVVAALAALELRPLGLARRADVPASGGR